MGLPVVLDVGQSIDDFFAIALAACSPELRLLGVTTAQDDGGLTARVVRSLLDAYGRYDVPVHVGSGGYHEEEFVIASTEGLLRSQCLPAVTARRDAGHFLNDLLLSRSDISIMVTGPLTNLASLLRHFPHRAADIRQVFFMGGWTSQALPDYNVRIDPEAAAYVLSQDIRLVAIGYEVTRGLRLLPSHLARLESSSAPGPQLLSLLVRTWCRVKKVSSHPLPDPIVVAYLCDQLPAQMEDIRVKIETAPGPGRGTMYQDQDGRQIRVFTHIDASGYMDFLLSRVAPKSPPMDERFDLTRWQLELNTAYRLDHYPGWSLSSARHSSHIVALIVSGEGEATVFEQDVPLVAGTALYVPPNQPRSLRSRHGMNALWFYFDVISKDAHDGLVSLGTLPWPTTFPTAPDTEYLVKAGERVIKYWQYARPEGPLLCNAALVELIVQLHTLAQEPPVDNLNQGQQAALRAKRWIEMRVTDQITLQQIADHASIDKFHLLRTFKDSFGVTPLNYQRQLRMQQALRCLKVSDMSISEIAADVGYASVTAFSRAFRRQYGVPPSAAREL